MLQRNHGRDTAYLEPGVQPPALFLYQRYVVHAALIALALIVGIGGRLAVNSAQATYKTNYPSVGYSSTNSLLPETAPTMVATPTPRQGIVEHTVESGDTLAGLASKYGISINTILWANGLYDENTSLKSGEEIKILPVSGVVHTVADGEDIDTIAEEYQSDRVTIGLYNEGVSLTSLRPGMDLIIPGGRPVEVSERPLLASRSFVRPPEPSPTADRFAIQVESAADFPRHQTGGASIATEKKTETTAGPLKPKKYTVADGDSFFAIADKLGLDAEAVAFSNGLSIDSAMLQPGEELTVPPVKGLVYKVQEGDSISTIADEFDVPMNSVVKSNAIDETFMLHPGDLLVIPGGTPPSPAPVTAAAPASQATHVVSAGESISAIADSYGVDPSAIARANGLSSALAMIHPGETLTIPGASASQSSAPAAAPAPKQPAPQSAQPAPSSNAWGVVGIASQYIGYAYAWGGTSPSVGFDCSGLTYWVYAKAGSYIPRDLWGQLQSGPRVKMANLQAGDLVFFVNTYQSGLSHVGIYAGGGRFIHAADYGKGVRVDSLYDAYWSAHYYAGARP